MMTKAEEAMVIAVIHEENGLFGVSFPDFPGCVTGAETIELAIQKAREVLAFHVAGMVKDGDEMPELSTMEQLKADEAVNQGWKTAAALVALRSECEGWSIARVAHCGPCNST